MNNDLAKISDLDWSRCWLVEKQGNMVCIYRCPQLFVSVFVMFILMFAPVFAFLCAIGCYEREITLKLRIIFWRNRKVSDNWDIVLLTDISNNTGHNRQT